LDDLEKRKRYRDLSARYLGGEQLPGVRYRHNSHVSFANEAGKTVEGWIVAVEPRTPEPVYTIERSDGLGDEEVRESEVQLILDPHQSKH
jgi:hypothetical protein